MLCFIFILKIRKYKMGNFDVLFQIFFIPNVFIEITKVKCSYKNEIKANIS